MIPSNFLVDPSHFQASSGPELLDAAVSAVLQTKHYDSAAASEACQSENEHSRPGSGSDRVSNSSSEMIQEHNGAFADWTFKNVDLLKDKNRQMAEQVACQRTETVEDPSNCHLDTG